MSSSVEKIKERLSIVDVISSYMQVDQSGKNFKAKCPFHNEKTPSFFISAERGTYYCFGCGEKGDIFSFVEKFEGTDFMGSLKLLAERAGVTLEDRNRNDPNKDKKETYYEILEEATKFFESNFEKEPKARAYLIGRGLTDATIKSFRIGYVKDEWRSLSDYLISKGYKKEDIEIVGLLKIGDKGFYDRFRSRIIFPLSDSSGRIIAFSGRIFGKDESTEAKYLNSPDTPLFYKSNVLFGIDKAKESIRRRGYSIIVEGQMDLIMSHQAGFTNTVAVSGTAFTDNILDNESKINNLGLIRRLSPKIIFAYDGDAAGIRAVSRSSMIALSLDMQVKVASLEEGKDPADIILENPDIWKDIIKNSFDIITFHIERICNNTSDIRLRGKQIRDIIFPFLVMIKSSIDKSAYISLINSKTGIPSHAIIEDFEIYERNHQVNNVNRIEHKVENNTESLSRRGNLEKRLFGIIFWYKKDNLDLDIDNIFNSLEERIGKVDLLKIQEFHEPFADILAMEAQMWYGDKTINIKNDIDEMILNLEEEILNERLILLKDLINRGTDIESSVDPNQILVDYQKTVERIANIRSYRSQ